MQYHPILSRQLKNHLHPDLLENDSMQLFLDKISKSYYSFERAQNIADHAFNISEKEYQEIYTSLVKSKEVAEEAPQAKSQFLSTMSHEIRAPLNAVIGFTQLLQNETCSPTQTEYLNLLHFSSENLLTLINNILDFSKIEAGKIKLEKNKLNLQDFFDKIYGTLSYSAREKHIKLSFKIDPAIPQIIKGDAGRLAQIFINLAGNAIKFTACGQVKVSATLVNKNSELTIISFNVADTGIGIAADKMDLIFENFTQATCDTTRKFGGTGLGLSITKKLLSLMESNVVVTSQLGIGSNFSFIIGFENDADEILEKNQESKPQNLKIIKGRKILVVDDNHINIMIVKRFLSTWEVTTEEATNGLIALEMVKNNQYDMVLMDLQMPVMDGYQAVEAIRNTPGNYYQKLPIVAFTASAMIEAREKIVDLGMNDFVNKPFNQADLYKKICSNMLDKTDSENLGTYNAI